MTKRLKFKAPASSGAFCFWPPQLAASFIPDQSCDVRYWHLTDKPVLPVFVRFRTIADKEWVLAGGGLSANDPKQTLGLRHSRLSQHMPHSRNVLDFRSVPI